jgi:hypothetical protein
MRSPPSAPQVTLSLLGLAACGTSLWIAFAQPYTIWPWLLLLLAGACLGASRRLK